MNTKKTLVINFNPGVKIKFALIFLGVSVLLPLALGSESLEVKTYYPAPYGSYNTITASDYMELGGTTVENRIKIGNLPYETSGIETLENDAYLISDNGNNLTIATISVNNMINLAGSKLINLCVWTVITDPQCRNLQGGVRKWQPVMMGIKVGSSYRTYYNRTAPPPGLYRNPIYHMGLHDKVLCCRLEDTNR